MGFLTLVLSFILNTTTKKRGIRKILLNVELKNTVKDVVQVFYLFIFTSSSPQPNIIKEAIITSPGFQHVQRETSIVDIGSVLTGCSQHIDGTSQTSAVTQSSPLNAESVIGCSSL